MTQSQIPNCTIAGVASAVPSVRIDNLSLEGEFPAAELRKIVQLAGIRYRYVSDGSICTSDLCLASARQLLNKLNWAADSIDALILVTQSPDYFLPSTASLLHRDLGLSTHCAVMDIGLGCSGYPYGLQMAAMMLNFGHKRVLLCQGDTPSLFTSAEDRGTSLLFGDAGTTTALEYSPGANPWFFNLQSDGRGFDQLIIPAGGFRKRHSDNPRDYCVAMNGAALFNFTLERVPGLISDTLAQAQLTVDGVDQYIFHQSNQFMMKHLAKKCGLPEARTPIILEAFGNTGGASVPLTLTQALPVNRSQVLKTMLLGYGVGLSWGAALVDLPATAPLLHSELSERLVGCT
ncbi:MAG TPA: ketoacyl-ACP synthase III [Cellvibrionaceae bacterium]